ncbi:MAG TPA: XdhC family protein [bacterium]|nr:XdhC family protein [bacterium]
MGDLVDRAHDLKAAGEPFALATVIRVTPPTSARPGMKAIVLADGTLEGWVGGSCAHPTVVREALRALREGIPTLVSLGPPEPARAAEEGVTYYPMTCHSGGTLQIYIEPILPRPQLLLVGESPLVAVLASVGRLEGFAVWAADDGPAASEREADLRLPLRQLASRITSSTYIVVATMGAGDEEALAQVAGTDCAYLGLVASRRRAEAVLADLRRRGLPDARLRRIRAPAGLDIGAVTPEEIALSIMAEIVQARRAPPPAAQGRRDLPASAPAGEEARDPVCGMVVEVATARHTATHRGRTFYFCGARCRQAFEADPARFLAAI